MNTYSYKVGELQTNCYLLTIENECLIIDPGDSAEFLLEEISRKNLSLQAILLTHGHFDHCMAAGEIQLTLDIPVFMNKKDQFLIDRLEETAKHFLQKQPVILKPTVTEIKGGIQKIGSFEFEVIETPGHTPGSLSFYFSTDSLLFCGDLMFKDSIGDYSHSYSNKRRLFSSIQTIDKYNAQIYPGHGDSF